MSYFSLAPGLTPAQVTALIARNEASGVAGLYACKTILNEHRPVCTKEYSLVGKNLTDINPDVWRPIVSGSGTITYLNRFLTITSSTNTAAGNRVVIDAVQFPITGNFEEVTCRIGPVVTGTGGVRKIAIGFASAFNAFQDSDRCIFYFSEDNWLIGYNGGFDLVSNLPIGRNLVSGDVVTVRLDRQEGSANIDIVRFYVNGGKQFETTLIPAVDMYAGIGVFNTADTTAPMSIAIDYFGFKYVP